MVIFLQEEGSIMKLANQAPKIKPFHLIKSDTITRELKG